MSSDRDPREVLQNFSERDVTNIRSPTGSEIWIYFDGDDYGAEWRLLLNFDQPHLWLQHRGTNDDDWTEEYEAGSRY